MLHSDNYYWPQVTDGEARGGSGISGRCEHPSFLKDRWHHLPSTRPWASFCPLCASASSSTKWAQALYLPPRVVGRLTQDNTCPLLSVGRMEGALFRNASYNYSWSCALLPGSGLWGTTHPGVSIPFPRGTSGSAQGSASKWQWLGLSSPICLGGI